MVKLHAIVHGRVQGVGFRAFVQSKATQLRLRGWVRNLPNRSVETVAIGPVEALDQFKAWLRRGPDGSRVDRIDDTLETPQPYDDYTGFDIVY